MTSNTNTSEGDRLRRFARLMEQMGRHADRDELLAIAAKYDQLQADVRLARFVERYRAG